MPEQHTPEPWVYEIDEDDGTFRLWMGSAADPSRRGVYRPCQQIDLYRDIYPGEDSFDEAAANTQLIGAAPKLLKACRLMAAVLQGFTASELLRRVGEIHPESFNDAQAALWTAIDEATGDPR
jgi:hypothetical protein